MNVAEWMERAGAAIKRERPSCYRGGSGTNRVVPRDIRWVAEPQVSVTLQWIPFGRGRIHRQ